VQALSDIPREPGIPEPLRDRLAGALEDLAVDVDAERNAFRALVEAADEHASLF
jgi:hypothetical protein